MAIHNSLGKWGEQVAADYLTTLGYAIHERNWRIPPYELDIVAFDGPTLVFVEVKTRMTGDVDPAVAITQAKRRSLFNAANAFLKITGLPHTPRFDLVLVVGTPDNFTVEHIPDAIYPSLKSYR